MCHVLQEGARRDANLTRKRGTLAAVAIPYAAPSALHPRTFRMALAARWLQCFRALRRERGGGGDVAPLVIGDRRGPRRWRRCPRVHREQRPGGPHAISPRPTPRLACTPCTGCGMRGVGAAATGPRANPRGARNQMYGRPRAVAATHCRGSPRWRRRWEESSTRGRSSVGARGKHRHADPSHFKTVTIEWSAARFVFLRARPRALPYPIQVRREGGGRVWPDGTVHPAAAALRLHVGSDPARFCRSLSLRASHPTATLRRTPARLAMSGSKRARAPAATSLSAAAVAAAEPSLADAPGSAVPAAPPKRPRPDAAAEGDSAHTPPRAASVVDGARGGPPVPVVTVTAADGAAGAAPSPDREAAAGAASSDGRATTIVSGRCGDGGSPAGGAADGDAPTPPATAPPAAAGDVDADTDAASAAVAADRTHCDAPEGAVTPSPTPGEDGRERAPADPAAGAGSSPPPPPAGDTTPEERVRSIIKALLNRWAAELAALPESDRRTYKVRAEYATCEQTVEHLRPLLRQLRKRTVARNILRALEEIFDHVAAREYVRANDRYLRLAIGNAPWPMGATMVGIHARSAREKIGEGKVAHVMNDEDTRKYITAIKRLVTLAQKYNPTVPSKMMSS